MHCDDSTTEVVILKAVETLDGWQSLITSRLKWLIACDGLHLHLGTTTIEFYDDKSYAVKGYKLHKLQQNNYTLIIKTE